MDFQLNEEQRAVQELAKNFAIQELAPHATEWDEQHIFPVATLKKAAELGMAGIYIPENIGGAGLSRLDAAIIFEELASACPSTAAYLSIHNMVAGIIDKFGDANQRKQWLPALISMEKIASYCLTEPGSGSDAAALKTTAVRDGDEYILNGTKAFISGGSMSDVYACMVRTGEAGPKGISCVLVEKQIPGISFGKLEQKLGWHSQPTTMVFFENCRIPIQNRIGAEGEGFKIALNALNGGRVNIAACSVGGAKTCLHAARNYMQEREQFQHKLADFQGLQFQLADMATELDAARFLTYRAANSLDNNDPEKVMHCAMAKRFASDVGFKIADDALQIYGGYGYLYDYPIQRYFRDLRVHRILEGTNEIMRIIIARRLFSNDFSF